MKKITIFAILLVSLFISSCQQQEVIRYTSVTMDSSIISNFTGVNCIVTIQGDNITIAEDSTYVTEGVRVKEGSNMFKCSNGMVYQVRDDGLYVYSGSGFMFKYF